MFKTGELKKKKEATKFFFQEVIKDLEHLEFIKRENHENQYADKIKVEVTTLKQMTSLIK